MNIKPLAILLLGYAFSGYAQTPELDKATKAQLEAVLRKNFRDHRINPHSIQFYSGQIELNYLRECGEENIAPDAATRKFKGIVNELSPGQKDITQGFRRAILEHEKKSEQEQLIFSASMYMGKIAARPVEQVPFIGPIIMDGVDKIIELGEKDLKETQQKKLALSLNQLREQNSALYNQVLTTGNLETVRNALQQTDYFVRTDIEVDDDNALIVHESKLKFLSSAVSSGLQRLVNEVDIANQRVDDIDRKLYGLASFNYEFSKKTNARIDALTQSQQKLENDLQSFYKTYQGDQKALNYMQGYLFEKMSPTEKIASLRGGFFPAMSNQEKFDLEQKIKLEQNKQEYIAAVGDALNDAGCALQVLDNLGLSDSNFARSLKEGVSIAQQGFTAFQAFSTQNYFQCAVAVTGIFAKEGPDISAQRHKQIIQSLERIMGKLDVIDNKLNTILENQSTQLELQVKTLETLFEISARIDSNQVATNKRLSDIEQRLYENRELILDQVKNECEACQAIIRRVGMDIDLNAFPDLRNLQQTFTDIRPSVEACEKYLLHNKFINQTRKINPFYKEITYVNNLESSRRAYLAEDNARDMINLYADLREPIFELNTRDRRMLSLYFPQQEYRQLYAKTGLRGLTSNSNNYILNPQVLSDYLSCEAVKTLAKIIRNYAFIVTLTGDDSRIKPLDELLGNTLTRNWTPEMAEVLELVNAAIAQQNILSGDALIPYFIKKTQDHTAGKRDTAAQAKLRSILTKNQLFAQNFLTLFLKNTFDSTGVSVAQYAYAYNTKDATLMNSLFKHPFVIKYFKQDNVILRSQPFQLPEGWYCQVDQTLIPLPSSPELTEPIVRHTNYMNDLLDSRDKLAIQVHNNTLYESLTKRNSKGLNYYIIDNH